MRKPLNSASDVLDIQITQTTPIYQSLQNCEIVLFTERKIFLYSNDYDEGLVEEFDTIAELHDYIGITKEEFDEMYLDPDVELKMQLVAQVEGLKGVLLAQH